MTSCLRRPLDYGCLRPSDVSGKGSLEDRVQKNGKYEYCYLFSNSDLNHFRDHSTSQAFADGVISPHMFNKREA